ncbi:MAG: FAD-dependent monooxygenase, partial [Acidobacteriota bacterium]|nr:FAD-dependent monooxygenase [Acidobacteriota bacterium]
VALVERASFPRDKLCGEFVSAEGCAVLQRLGLLDGLRRAGARPIRHCYVGSAALRGIETTLPDWDRLGCAAYAVTRSRLDAALLEAAADAGVEVFDRTRTVAVIDNGTRIDAIRVRHERGRGERELHGLVVGADGRRSLIARGIDRGDRHLPTSDWYGLKAYYPTAPPPARHRVELHLFDGGYVGRVEVEDERSNVCMMVRRDSLRRHGGADPLLAHLGLVSGERLSRWHGLGPLTFGPRRAAGRGALLIGDAAGTVDPYSGEGISHALLAAEYCLPYVLAAIAEGTVTQAAERQFQKTWNRRFRRASWRIRLLGRVLESPIASRPMLRWLNGPARSWIPWVVRQTRTAAEER